MTRRKVHVRWGEAVTPSGSRVKVGVVDESGDIYMLFTPAKGKGNARRKTRLCLTRPAMDAVHKLWSSWLDFEAKRGQWAYAMMSIVRRLPPTVPWAYAGIPPIKEPNSMHFKVEDSQWRMLGAGGIPKQPETQLGEHE